MADVAALAKLPDQGNVFNFIILMSLRGWDGLGQLLAEPLRNIITDQLHMCLVFVLILSCAHDTVHSIGINADNVYDIVDSDTSEHFGKLHTSLNDVHWFHQNAC